MVLISKEEILTKNK